MSSQYIINGVKFSRSALVIISTCVILQLTREISSTNQPSLEVIPTPPEEQSERDLIYLRRNYNASMWSDRIAGSLEDYYAYRLNPQGQDRIYRCDDNNPAPKGSFCGVDMRVFGKCGREYYFGYDRYNPCVFLRINPTPGWVPEYYNNTTDLPDDMPDQIRSQISVAASQNSTKLQRLWVSCDGDWPADKEFIGPVKYYPEQGYPWFYFPRDESNYLRPLIAIEFKRPTHGVIIYIECRLWAKNIQYDKKRQIGYKSFQLLMD